jgi:transposase-like protein
VVTRPDEGMEDELPLNDEDRARIIELYQERVPVTEIAEEFGVTRETIHTIITRAGVQTHAEARRAAKAAARQGEFAEAIRDMLRFQGVLSDHLQTIERRLAALEGLLQNGGEHSTHT